MSKIILGLDLGSNSIGWALLEEAKGKPNKIIDLGSRIFTKAVEEKTPTPKNVKRRDARLARRVVQRRARRKQKMLNYLISLKLLPIELQGNTQPEIILNNLGNPYKLRAQGLNKPLKPFEMGRVLLHLVQRRGFLSNRKTLLGDMVDDPDVLAIINELDNQETTKEKNTEEGAFKQDISKLRETIEYTPSTFNNGDMCRTLGEYLANMEHHTCQRNRSREGGHLRSDRQMYHEELNLIWQKQAKHNTTLTNDVKEQIEQIIFFQRPLKLKDDRVGKCSLEPSKKRAQQAKLECQKFRYLQDINNLQYFDPHREQWTKITTEDKEALKILFESKATITFPQIRKKLGLDRHIEFNLEQGNKKLKGNITACDIRAVLPSWDNLNDTQQHALVEDIITIKKKSVLKKRLINHWQYDLKTSINLCLLELEPAHSNLSIKAIRKLLPYLEEGKIYSDARIAAGYDYEQKKITITNKLGMPPELANPIVSKGLHELRRVINALIAEYGKPDIIRIEMARDLEMNTKRYKDFISRQKKNTSANDEAIKKFQLMGAKNPHLKLRKYPSHNDKLRYRLWKDQGELCAYSGQKINLSTLFSPEIEIDHILPYSESLDDSYMNKVVCYTDDNRLKGQRTPIDAFSSNTNKWQQITGAINHWHPSLKSKKNRFYMTAADVQQRDFINSQLNDTRYICRVAHDYLQQLGADINVTKGIMTGWLRHMWGLDSLIGQDRSAKDRTDHRHHTIDAIVTACIDRRLYNTLVKLAKELEKKSSQTNMRDIHIDPPWQNLREDLDASLQKMIVAHTPHRKLTGGLHEETGAGFIEGIGTVYRANLNTDFKLTQAKKIIDPDVKEIINKHLEQYDNEPKKAFAEGITVLHKDGKTPIKRVRILQAKTTLKKLEANKLGIKNKEGKVFRWMAYGNLHHVEILKEISTGKHIGKFVTTLEASHRARGINMEKQAIIKTNHSGFEFIMALHINDLVSINEDDEVKIYRVQKLDKANKRIKLRLHNASTLKNTDETLPDKESTIPSLINKGMKIYKVNAIGKTIT